MSTRISLTYCGMEGSGATVKEAKQDAARKIEAALDGSYAPTLVRGFADDIRLVCRAPDGWNILRIDDRKDGDLFGCSMVGTKADAIAQARMSLAQDAIFRAPDHGLSILTDKSARRQHADYVAWQMAARDGQSKGVSDPHAYACEHETEFRGWQDRMPVAS